MSVLSNALSAPSVKASLVLKNGTAENWALLNPVLLKGELGLENDTRLLKAGDGTTAFNNLPYINALPEQLTNYFKKPEAYTVDNFVCFSEQGEAKDSGVSLATLAQSMIAAEGVLGTVMGSSENNSVSIQADGTMTLNDISVEKLYVPAGCDFILDAGNAS